MDVKYSLDRKIVEVEKVSLIVDEKEFSYSLCQFVFLGLHVNDYFFPVFVILGIREVVIGDSGL